MDFFVTVTGAVIATLVMAAVMYTLVWDGFRHGDMIRLLGTDVTTDPKKFFTMGMIMYFVSGMLLSWFYYKALSFLNFDSVTISSGIGGFMGFVQGFVMINFYVTALGSRHPSESYNRNWLPLSLAHWFGHILFGVSLGSIISAFLIHGLSGFYVSAFVNVLFIAGAVLAAKKSQIISTIRHRQESHV
ncbi:hypothetical protein [Oligoflexus tunisiensis]|uniref:hypothetical protein n=1 Tax=Oligoflexus tunisiensis TaxID=708132 RepID=UPI00114D1D35|nr:hypothetical protein [Oligoflexus tunisiensis]